MMMKKISLSARREFLISVRQTYQDADWINKGRVLDGVIAATGYERKYAIHLLNRADFSSLLFYFSLAYSNR